MPTPTSPPSLWRGLSAGAAQAARQLWRDWRAGELRLLVLAVVLAVAALTAVAFFADRLHLGLNRDARQLLGGDAVLASDQALPTAFAEQARAMGLTAARTVSFPSMARAPESVGGQTRLVSVKAVSETYPLRGQLRWQDAGGETSGARGPEPGTVWVDAAVLDALQLQLGDTLLLGDAQLRIAARLVAEPDRGAGFVNFAPRVMLTEADLAATELIQPASRVTYRLALASPRHDDTAVRRFSAWAEAQIRSQGLRGVRLESLESGRPEMRQAIDRAEKFLRLVALLAALLSAVAVSVAARDYAQRHLDDCAMLRVLGLPQRTMAWQYLAAFVSVGLAASALGVALGWGVHHVFVALLAGLLNTSLPAASAWPALLGLGVGLTLLLGFGLPPVLQLARVPPLRVIRRDMGALKPASAGVLAAGALSFAALLLAVSGDITLGLIAVGGFAVAMLCFALLAWLALIVLRRVVPESRAPRWLVLAVRQLVARPGAVVLQTAALSVGLLALSLLILLRTDLVNGWRQATPADAPNRFVINIQPEQGAAFQAALRAQGVTRYDWVPMIRGRLTAINGRAVAPEHFASARAQRLVEREFNLSHSATLPAHNLVDAGRWVNEEPGAWSVESGLAETLGLRLGDTLRFDIAGQSHEGRITSLRKLDWGSMRANFFVLSPRSTLADVPATTMAVFRAPDSPGFDRTLSREFPNLTLVDVSATVTQIQQVLGQVTQAVEFLFGFTLAAGLLVLFATVSASREGRAREFAVMRALGASSALLARVQRAELLGLGALAGLLSAMAALAVGWALARFVFQFSWQPSPWVPLGGLLSGALLAWAAGWWGLRSVLNRPVIDTLRRSTAE